MDRLVKIRLHMDEYSKKKKKEDDLCVCVCVWLLNSLQ